MTDAPSSEPRRYRFAPLDRGGWLLGLDGPQCVSLGAGLLIGGWLLQQGAPALVVLGPLLGGAVAAFGTVGSRPARELAPLAVRWIIDRLLGRHEWVADLPVVSRSAGHPVHVALPPWMRGIEVLDVPLASNGDAIGIVRDMTEHTSSASLLVSTTGFSLLEGGDQERRLEGWGEVMAAFCAERSAVTSIRVTESAAAGSLARDRAFLDAHGRAPDSLPTKSYMHLLDVAEPLILEHEALVTVTVDERKVRGRGPDRKSGRATASLLAEELRLLSLRLRDARLTAQGPLSAGQLSAAFRRRLDPPTEATSRRSLAAMTGLVSPSNRGPLAARSEWSYVQVDSTLHRAYWIAEWPRLEVPSDWLEQLLLHAGGPRVVSIHYEPVSPSRSRRRVDRDSTRLSADEEQRVRHGFRIGASHRRSQSAVLDREEELVSGFAELEYVGFVIVSASDAESLDRNCAEYEQAAARCGLDLRSLDGQHACGLVLALPVGRGLTRRRWL